MPDLQAFITCHVHLVQSLVLPLSPPRDVISPLDFPWPQRLLYILQHGVFEPKHPFITGHTLPSFILRIWYVAATVIKIGSLLSR